MADGMLFGEPQVNIYDLPYAVAEEVRFVQSVVNAYDPDD